MPEKSLRRIKRMDLSKGIPTKEEFWEMVDGGSGDEAAKEVRMVKAHFLPEVRNRTFWQRMLDLYP